MTYLPAGRGLHPKMFLRTMLVVVVGRGGGGVGVGVVVVVGGRKGQFCSASIQLKKKEDQIQEGRTASYVDGGSHAHHERSELVGKAWTC